MREEGERGAKGRIYSVLKKHTCVREQGQEGETENSCTTEIHGERRKISRQKCNRIYLCNFSSILERKEKKFPLLSLCAHRRDRRGNRRGKPLSSRNYFHRAREGDEISSAPLSMHTCTRERREISSSSPLCAHTCVCRREGRERCLSITPFLYRWQRKWCEQEDPLASVRE